MATIAAASGAAIPEVDKATYNRRIRAWTLYDWANSAFATTIMAAILPAYYSAVAGANLPSPATATAYWSLTNSIALFIIALLSPILGTISDVMRGKKKFLSLFIGIGTVGTGLLILVSTGDWLLASLFYIIGRIGFGGANIFYDSLLPHVAVEADQDRVSTLGYAMGYIGGGVLLAINVVMLQLIPESWFAYAGIRLSFLSVAIWWALFSIPILRAVPEPRAATAALNPGETVVGVSFARMRATFADIRQYSDLFRYLIAFLIYNDAIGTIIGLAVIYGVELGFQTLELVLALLLVQFVGVPFTLIFGSLPASDGTHSRRHYYLAFVVFNAVAMPILGVLAATSLSPDVTGKPPAPYETTNTHYGEGTYLASDSSLIRSGEWQEVSISSKDQAGSGLMAQLTLLFSPPDDATYEQSSDGIIEFPINGQRLEVKYATGPANGSWSVEADGAALADPDAEDGSLLVIDTQDEHTRYGETEVVTLPEPGEHTIRLVPVSGSGMLQIAELTVLPPLRSSSLMTIFALLLAAQAIGVVFALITGRLFKPLSDKLDTRRSILVSLAVYSIIAVWGFFLQATIEFWYLAWMVAVVQGGSQALSRSLYASMCPSSKSGEFFGLFSIMTKFSSILGPMLFALAVAIFGSSRPAILSLIVLFVLGGYLLTRVNIEEGQRVARDEDAEIYGTASA